MGDGRTVALIGRDGAIDWLCLPGLDSGAVFGALLDSDHGGSFLLAPGIPFEARRRYLPGTNVLQTTYRTSAGTVKVTDAMTLPVAGLAPARELVRVVDGVSGAVPMRWTVRPAFGYGLRRTRLRWRAGVPVATSGADAVAICSWGAGDPALDDNGVTGNFEAQQGVRAVFAVSGAHEEPLVIPARPEVEQRLAGTCEMWRRWAGGREYKGPWKRAVIRSALALKLLVYAPSGAVAAAATTSLPEALAGKRNWDYRLCWLRDSSFTLSALLGLGCTAEADAFFWWLMHASQLTHPELQVFYRLDGSPYADEGILDLPGYRSSRPVRTGNAAATQEQLDIYGSVLETAWHYAQGGRPIDKDIGRRLAAIADLVCRIWQRPDAGLWEVRGQPRHFTHSKMMCWVALDRAIRLAGDGHLPDENVSRWRDQAGQIRDFVERRCWSDAKQAYTRFEGDESLDAALLLAVLFGFSRPSDPRFISTVRAVRRELADGPFLYRYVNEDGLPGREGCFLACSFWLVEALSLMGARDEAVDLMEQLVHAGNDVGLYAEEIDPVERTFLGNFPQALTHLALISAARSLQTHST